jgi:hypothetical protein
VCIADDLNPRLALEHFTDELLRQARHVGQHDANAFRRRAHSLGPRGLAGMGGVLAQVAAIVR